MNSEQEDGTDHLDEPNANSDANVDQSPEEKGNGPREHAKPRRRRRGKKRKQKKESAAACGAANPEECESELHVESEHGDCDSPVWASDENLRRYYDSFTDVIIRPVNVPKAPLNSTQFIMDDHDDCKFYMSFETPNPYGDTDSHHLDRETGDIIEPVGEDAAYIDIDYQYESPQDFDNSAYYDKEFELSYKNNRFEELMRSTRTELIMKLQAYESRLKELSEDLVKENPSPVLEKLQAELLELQEKNSFLKECNTDLTAVLNATDGSEIVAEGISISHDERESEDSEREVYAECNEVIMSDNENDICDNRHNIDLANNLNDKDDGSDNLTKQNIDNEQIAHHGEDIVKTIDHSEESTDQKKCRSESTNFMTNTAVTVDDRLFKKMEADTYTPCDTTINSERKRNKHVHSNSHLVHCQADGLVSDDLRTLNIISSELFHNANQTKCSSSVPLEGGMSPSETSVK